MKNEESIDRILQINNIDIGKNIAKLRKAMTSETPTKAILILPA